MYNMMYGYGYGGYGPEFAVFHVLGWIFWILVVLFVIRLVFGRRHWRRSWYEHDRALDILKERYAKGEINKDEFEAKKKDLQSW